MGLIITQGKQASNITADNVHMQIVRMEFSQYVEGALNITFKLLDGTYSGRMLNDTIVFDPKEKSSWKYLALRRSAKVPYHSDEPETIDIEALLLNKVVTADLGVKTSESNGKEYQTFNYKAPKDFVAKEEQKAEMVEISADEELPFGVDDNQPKATEAERNFNTDALKENYIKQLDDLTKDSAPESIEVSADDTDW